MPRATPSCSDPTPGRRSGLATAWQAATGLVLSIALLFGLVVTAPPAHATTSAQYNSMETEFLSLLNKTRAAKGLGSLALNIDVRTTSRAWSRTMLANGTISHDPNLAKAMTAATSSWTRAGENVGVGYSVRGLHDAFYNSAGHRANMLGDYNQVGIGAEIESSGRIWVTVRFAKAGAPPPIAPADAIGVRRSNQVLPRESLTTGPSTMGYAYGGSGEIVLMGDWDGDGDDTPGVYRSGTWYLRNDNSPGSANIVFAFGGPRDVPVVGDWNGDGRDTVGVRQGSTWKLRNVHSGGAPSIAFNYGSGSDRALVGDWNGDGTDTIGIRRGGEFVLRNSNSGGPASVKFVYGSSSDVPMVGDWDGNGTTTVGVKRGNLYLLRNSNSGGKPSRSFTYASSSDRAFVGNW